MSMAIACWVRDTVLQENAKELQYKRTFLNSMIVSNTKLNTTIPGMEGYKRNEVYDNISKAQQTYKEFGWIIKG